ncbi:hypothetical protein [Clostridium sp. VAP41]|uniref:hypothetical protein n=1 Tax=Clostridium sp. VAP41 TaxID=2949979 RepID=UPI00207AB554|nr:hypothetical protein [Clostridium sp. VAP41]
MSKKSDLLEQNIADLAHNYSNLPSNLPPWMKNLGIIPSSQIISSRRIGSENRNNKTDILITLENSVNIKISAKLSSADYFGNWYGHVRFLEEFGNETFYKLTKDATEWANWWITQTDAPFVGVSICFGRRSGNTARRFLDIFSPQDILSIVKGFESDDNDATANCMYISSKAPTSLEELINNLVPITLETIEQAVGEFMIAYRPINPITEGTNRGKNVYTQFIPHKKLDNLTKIISPKEIETLGEFEVVEPNRLNHNHILNKLESEYNILIPRKK